jgi:hypothetical protein
MNYGELKTAILSDSHREDYTDYVARFVAEAEAMIRARLTGYELSVTLTDADRNNVLTSSVYTMPSALKQVRYVIPTDCAPLDQVDETLIAHYRTMTQVLVYAVRSDSIVVAGTPAEAAEFTLRYFGLPAPLTLDADTNALLTDFPQLYKEAAQVPLFKRARNFEAAQIAFQSANSLIDEINRTMRKKQSGARSANPYNVNFRSSY